MAEKPTYLGLLNTIAVVETRAHAYLTAWADVTPDPDVRAVLRTVAAREGEHGMSFAKRVNELGFEVRCNDDPGFETRMEIAGSDRSDLEKIEALELLRFRSDDEPDVFDTMFRDHSIDIQTGALLGRYIAEERDTLRLLQGCCTQLQAPGLRRRRRAAGSASWRTRSTAYPAQSTSSARSSARRRCRPAASKPRPRACRTRSVSGGAVQVGAGRRPG